MKNHFPKHEIECRCGCGIANISPMLLEILNHVRDEMGKAVYLTNACRCPKHNLNVGGVAESSHITTEEEMGEAADISCYNSHDRFLLVKYLLKWGVTRILIYPSFIHIDVDKEKPQEVLVYAE